MITLILAPFFLCFLLFGLNLALQVIFRKDADDMMLSYLRLRSSKESIFEQAEVRCKARDVFAKAQWQYAKLRWQMNSEYSRLWGNFSLLRSACEAHADLARSVQLAYADVALAQSVRSKLSAILSQIKAFETVRANRADCEMPSQEAHSLIFASEQLMAEMNYEEASLKAQQAFALILAFQHSRLLKRSAGNQIGQSNVACRGAAPEGFRPPSESCWLVVVECRYDVVRVSDNGEGFFLPGQEPCWSLSHVQEWIAQVWPVAAAQEPS